MNPAPSIVFFTTASGAGYGLLFWLGLLRPLGLVQMSPMPALVALVLALALITAGLLSSTLHLGNPKRAWRAFSQWRSSWLSREGVAAVLTYIPALLLGLGLWVGAPALAVIAGLLAAAGAVATVYCTAMIYASLKPIRQWRHPLVVPGYLALSAFSGAVLLAMLAAFSGSGTVPAVLAILSGAAALLLKRAYWRGIDAAPPIATIESATTLGFIGKTRTLEPPHTEQNYLLREMGFRIARKHAAKLRLIAQLGGFALPVLLAVLALLAGGGLATLALTLGAVLTLAGLLVERWLMFAEATHTVTLYYSGT
ncbi:dimethyl sulfoxide reductase anchor subunit [Belnapia sp. T6]|uniref:Dimethyl sulfoxide reductase anchor subunit n=1 Tax=Belnapia mucosa TaxID=2804532 RepID=A0ABS1V404_9PROT|nr:DmsC/YnfH family molybdoenzyme membrane anchor subunit [Belnapia mucosa]MBL6456410.1 dimethyl sulfoxide reductase anchor subunit [Belnapia mucosa]